MRNRPFPWISILMLLLSFPPALRAQTAYRVRDLDAGFDQSNGDAYPNHLVVARGKLFFQAREPGRGGEIWVSDGTAAGTRLLADTCTSFCDNAEIIGTAGDLVFFRGDRGDLWRTDGTRAGSWPLLPDTLRVGQPSDGAVFAAIGGVLYFMRCISLCELWRTDGTESGTQSVQPIGDGDGTANLQLRGAAAGRLFLTSGFSPNFKLWISDGTPGGTTLARQFPGLPQRIAATPGRIFLLLPATASKEELWASDGTAAGTVLLASFPKPDFSEAIPWFKIAGDRVYFIADDLTHGQEIWRSDGTPQGTERVTEIGFFAPFGDAPYPAQFEVLGDRVVFLATNGLSKVKLWSAQSAATPPTPLAEVCGESCDPFFTLNLARVGNRVIFPGFDSAHGVELWATGGTTAGTARVADVCPGTCDGFDGDLVAGAGAAFVPLRDGSSVKLWRTDGTAQGTRAFAKAFFYGEEFVAVADKTFFSAQDANYGWELWANDGTTAESRPVTDIAPGAIGSSLSALSPLGDRIAFLANAQDNRVWVSAGTAETTVGVDSESFGFPTISDLTVAGVRLFYFREDFSDLQLWASDGTPGGTLQVTAFPGDDDLFHALRPLIEHQGHALFPVYDHGTLEMWRSDGTSAGTGLSFVLPSQIRGVSYLRSLGDRIFLLDGRSDPRPWLSDGTTAGTRELSTQPLDSFAQPEAVRLGALTFFAVNHLWRSDGTAAGTFQVTPANFYIGAKSHALTVFQNGLYFLAGDQGGTQALWRSDGTVAGTLVVKRFTTVVSLIQAAGKLYLAADDGSHGTELWTSDGTAAGTVLVRDIFPGEEGSGASSLCEAAGRLYFAAYDGVHGSELWISDGTAAGTHLAQDIAPEALSSRPEQLTVAGNRLYFTADDGQTGRELWALPLDAAPGVCTPSPTSLCLSGGRYRVEALWRDPAGPKGSGQAVALTADTGYFWFFGPENVEAIVKVLDGHSLNDHVWVFYGTLSNVEYSLTVTDVQTGLTRRYFNPQGMFASVGDTMGFGPLGAYERKSIASAAVPPLVTERADPAAATGSCIPGATRLCLNGGRFAVEASWKDFSGHTGTGTAAGLTGDTGYFWFFGASNVETVIKVLDGRPVNGKFWVFYGALSNVEYTLTVTDTTTGTIRTYNNPLGRFASSGDTSAF